MTTTRTTRAASLCLAATLATGLAACGSSAKVSTGVPSGQPGKGKPAVTLGDKNFPEQYVLGDLYAQALQAKGYTVNLKANIGSSELIDKALTSGQISMYPEYTGVIYTELANLGDKPASAAITYQGAKKWEAGRGYSVLDPTPFQDADGLATTQAYASAHNLKTIGDLSSAGSFTYGGPPENGTRYQGVLGLQQAYRLNSLKFLPLPIGTQYTALDEGKVNTIAIFTTDPQLLGTKYKVLTDTKGIFGFQQVVPVVKASALKAEGPAFSQILNAVSAKLTLPAIQAMNKAVQIDQQDPGAVAGQFLSANGLK